MAVAAQHKKDSVKEFTKLIDDYNIVGVVNMKNLPTKQLQKMREKLQRKVFLKMTKKRLIKIALGKSKKEGITQLESYLKGMPAMIFTNENPFSLFSTLKKSKSKAPISGGQTAPNDIVVPAGKTSFSPGPVIGELGEFGIISGVENGKVAIKKDSIVAKEGDEVSPKLAVLLQRLGIEPMEIGLDLVAVYENKEILTKDILDIDEEAYKKDFQNAASMAFNLAINAAYPTKDTITLLIQKAATESKALAIEADILTDETVGLVLAKAERQASGLNSKLDIKVDVPKEEVKPAEPAPAKGGEAEATEEKKDEKSTEDAPKEEVKEESKPEESS
ncbi:50S ribosomal protein L10 [archaeon]|nr:50S ribosomal protein L10 [archaeon]MBL7057026.1 50S ribosomal protein L10 [Candidatus Woesearchaeota archaeon]